MYRPGSITRRIGRPLFAASFVLAFPLAPLGADRGPRGSRLRRCAFARSCIPAM